MYPAAFPYPRVCVAVAPATATTQVKPEIIWFIGAGDGKDRFGLGAIGAAENGSSGAGVGLVTADQSMLPLLWGCVGGADGVRKAMAEPKPPLVLGCSGAIVLDGGAAVRNVENEFACACCAGEGARVPIVGALGIVGLGEDNANFCAPVIMDGLLALGSKPRSHLYL